MVTEKKQKMLRMAESEAERKALLKSLRDTREELRRARLYFNSVSAPELIESSVYEINSIQARYNYLLRRLREEGAADTIQLFK